MKIRHMGVGREKGRPGILLVKIFFEAMLRWRMFNQYDFRFSISTTIKKCQILLTFSLMTAYRNKH